MRKPLVWACVTLAALAGCRAQSPLPRDARTARADAEVRARFGRGIDELPRLRLDVISAHNENITQEFTWAFSIHHARTYGQAVDIVWRDVGGGGSAIQTYLENVYGQADSSDIDVLWGGGDLVFSALSRPIGRHADGVFLPLDLPDDVLANVPSALHGQGLYRAVPGADGRQRVLWIGSALSGFGFLYNAKMLSRLGIPAPRQWEDLGSPRLTDLLVLADPAQSGSVTATYLTIVKSAPTWPVGWARLLEILSNAKRIADSAGAAANAPVLGDALVATCIDFYGLLRVAEAPDELTYVSPSGQTAFGADPIGILKGAPHEELARRFVDFVMSARGQALWALRVGEPDGPVRYALGRQPIRTDVYTLYAGRLTPSTVNPFEAQYRMSVAKEMDRLPFGVFRTLVVAAAVDNIDGLREARRRLNELAADSSRAEEHARRLALFRSLPPEAETIDRMRDAANRMKDPVDRYNLTRAWRDHFRRTFQEVAR